MGGASSMMSENLKIRYVYRCKFALLSNGMCKDPLKNIFQTDLCYVHFSPRRRMHINLTIIRGPVIVAFNIL
jgi:predicted Rdx family selenoprotein